MLVISENFKDQKAKSGAKDERQKMRVILFEEV